MMRLRDYPQKARVQPGLVERVSVEALCCKRQFHRRRVAVFGLFRIVKCPWCRRRALILEAVTDRDWSRHGGDAARLRDEVHATGVDP